MDVTAVQVEDQVGIPVCRVDVSETGVAPAGVVLWHPKLEDGFLRHAVLLEESKELHDRKEWKNKAKKTGNNEGSSERQLEALFLLSITLPQGVLGLAREGKQKGQPCAAT